MLVAPGKRFRSQAVRREIFAVIVNAYNTQCSPQQCRIEVAREYGLTYSQIVEIEREGFDNGWSRTSLLDDPL